MLEAMLKDKIESIRRILEGQCIIKATDFDKGFTHPDAHLDPNGSAWNPYVHENCLANGFEVWSNGSRNFYVKNTPECILKAKSQGLRPHTTKDLFRGNNR